MARWQEVLAGLTSNVEDQFDTLKFRLKERLGSDDPVQIVPYHGYGSRERVFLRGRVLEDEGITVADENDRLWDNLLNMYRRLESDEIPHAHLRLHFAGVTEEVVADEEGFFATWLDLPELLPAGQLWHQAEWELLSPRREDQGAVRATGHVMVAPATARFGVISDIDDTVMQSHATDLVRMARLTFLGNARTRLPFPGVAAFYRALQGGTGPDVENVLFYLSSSPWNLYDLLHDFFRLQDIPLAPTFLRDWGLTSQELLPTEHRGYKLEALRTILDFYEDLPFILIGDSGQEDPEIYHEVVQEYPGRILAVYIRDVSPDERDEAVRALAEEVAAAQSTLILAEDTMAMARHAAEQGWIAPEMVAHVEAAIAENAQAPTAVEALLEQDEDEAAA